MSISKSNSIDRKVGFPWSTAMRAYLAGFMLIISANSFAQNPASTFEIPNRTINLPCGQNCTPLAVNVPHIKESTTYVLTNPVYLPFAYVTPGGIDITTLIASSIHDDQWTSVISLPFPVCYYGNMFTSLIVGTNSAICFDISRASTGSGYSIATTGTIPNTAYAPNMIFGPYHDIDIDQPGPNKRIEYRIEGVAPRRRFIASFNDVPYFSSSCSTQFATHQMVVYEGTGIVEVYIKDKPFCTAWNGGRTILGMQNQDRTQAIAAPGKNATVWGSVGMNECYRFIPDGGTPKFTSASLLLNGNVVATADTSTSAPGKLNLNFGTICPPDQTTVYHLAVTYTDCNNPANQITFTDSVTINKLPSSLIGNAVVASASCGADNGSITVNNVAGGTGPYLYSIDAGVTWQLSNVFGSLAQGTYLVKVKDVSGVCTLDLPDIEVPTTGNLAATVSATATACTGVNNGSITISSAAGTGPHTFTLDAGTPIPGTIPYTFTNLAAGNHTIVVTDLGASCSSGPLPITVSVGAGITATTTAAATSCPTAANGTITINATAGVAPFTYQIDGGAFQAGTNPYIFSGLSAGSHTIIIRDALGCQLNRTVTVSAGPTLTATLSSNATSCSGAINGTLSVTPSSGTAPFAFSLDNGPFVTGTVPYVFTGLSNGTHGVVVRDALGCTSNATTTTILAGPAITSTASTTPVICNGGNTGTLTILQPAVGTAPFEYSLDGISWQTTTLFSGLTAGTYTVRFRESAGCLGSTSVNLTEPTAIDITVATVPVVCNGQPNGLITVTSAGGVPPYLYSIDNGINWQTANGFSVLAGNYTVIVKDANNCQKTSNLTVTEPGSLTATVTTVNATCNGGNDGGLTITASGGNGTYQYSIDNGVNWQATNSFNLPPGNYTVTVKDILNCTYSVSAIVGLTNDLQFTPQTDITICESKSTQLNLISNGLQYDWSPATGLSAVNIPNPVASPLTTTQYIVQVTLGRCAARDTVMVTVNLAPIPNAGPDIFICYGQSATLQGSGGTLYQWSPATFLNNPSLPNAVSTPNNNITYVLKILSDINGCAGLVTDSVDIDVTPPIQVLTFPADTIGYPGDQFQLLAVPSDPAVTIYSWTPSVGLNNASIADPLVTIGAIGADVRYKVVASTLAGCIGEAYVNVRVYKGPDIYVPTGFTPNGDGKNDKFTPFPVGMKSYNYFRVFNRWGQLVFQSKKLNDGWDGTIGGQLQPDGVYVWMIEGLTKDNRIITKKGTVMLIK